MLGAVLTAALAALLTAGTVPVPDVPATSSPAITLTVANWGHPVSLLDAAHPGWAHLAPLAGPTEVTATIQLNGVPVHRWVARLTSGTAYGGVQPEECRGAEEVAPSELTCVFEVAVSRGVNPLMVSFFGDDRAIGDAEGAISGGDLQWDAGFEILDATGRWTAIAHDHAALLPSAASTAVRVVVANTGTIPMRLEPVGSVGNEVACSRRTLQPHERLDCPWRGVRPARSLEGDFRRELRVVDAVGSIGEYEVRGGLTTFEGTFSLGASSATVGGQVVVTAAGLPTGDPFALQFRLDDEAVFLATSITRTGHLRLSFPLPSTSIGSARINVVHDGITIASLPFDVTLVPRKVDAAPPVWPWLLLLVPIVGLIVLLGLRTRRRRRRAAA
jgi:hypothetical protein